MVKGIRALVAAAALSTYAVEGAPCDIYAQGGTPCVAAHSMVREGWCVLARGDLVKIQMRMSRLCGVGQGRVD